MPSMVWIDGTWHDRGSAVVSVWDHGLLYGDGVFEGIRAYGGRVFRLDAHLDRLYASAKAIWLEIPMAKDAMGRMVEEGVAKSGIKDNYIRLVVTRGVGDLGLDPRKCPKPTVFCIFDTIKLWPQDRDRKSTRLNSSHVEISYAVFCLKKKKIKFYTCLVFHCLPLIRARLNY